jgi:AraC family transcriptional regulator
VNHFDAEAFLELPLTFAQGRNGSGATLSSAPWGQAHNLGYMFYYPTYFTQSHIKLRHHLIGIEYEPGVVRMQMGSGLTVDKIVKSRACYFVPAGSTVEVRKENACEFVLITLDPALCERLLPGLGVRGMMDNIMNEAVADAAFWFRSRLLRGEEVTDHVETLTRSVMAALAQQLAGPVAAPEPVRISSARIKRALDFIGTNYAKKISVEEIATAVGGISAFHFAHIFRSSLGQPPHQYVLEHKLHRARTLLTETDHDIAGIAYSVGFSSQAHMTEAFSRRVGVTPAQLRRSVSKLVPKSPSQGRSAHF